MTKPKQLLVGLKSKEHAAEVVELACQLADRGASIYLVHVVELPKEWAPDAPAPDLERAARRVLRAGVAAAARSSRKVITLAPRGRSAGEVLLEELRSRNTELGLFVCGRDPASGEVLSGSTLSHLARHARCRLLFLIPAQIQGPAEPPIPADGTTPE